jgi:hypothetical protein
MGPYDPDNRDEPKRKSFLARYGWLLILFLVLSFGTSFFLRNAGVIVKAATNGNVDLSSTQADATQAPTTKSDQAASSATAAPSLESVLKTPDEYLNLMSSDPSMLPPVKRPIAIALNKRLEAMKATDDEQRNAEKDFQTEALDTIQSPKDKQHLESAKAFATNLKTISEKRSAFYTGIQESLANDLKAAGAPDEMVTKVSTLFVQRSGVESGITRSAAVEKIADDILAIMGQLQQNSSKWKTSADGKMTFTDREVMNKFNSLIQTLNADMKNVQPPITAL